VTRRSFGARSASRAGGGTGLASAAIAIVAASVLAAGCGTGAPRPAPLDTRNEQCAHCRMAVSDARFAAQLVAPGELPRFFDDIGCLADFLKGSRAPAGSAAFVADHRTKAWLPAERAVYTRVPGLQTPMGSHVIAHADAASRDADPDAATGAPVAVGDLLGAGGPPAWGAK
jgi:copper chaperone NosL